MMRLLAILLMMALIPVWPGAVQAQGQKLVKVAVEIGRAHV